jgi:hypothetical protein
VIDDFHRPALAWRPKLGRPSPDYVGADLAIDRALIEAELRRRPVVLRGSGGPWASTSSWRSARRRAADGRQLIVLDPWPALGRLAQARGPHQFTSASLRHRYRRPRLREDAARRRRALPARGWRHGLIPPPANLLYDPLTMFLQN